jgi:hypothetical protein
MRDEVPDRSERRLSTLEPKLEVVVDGVHNGWPFCLRHLDISVHGTLLSLQQSFDKQSYNE